MLSTVVLIADLRSRVLPGEAIVRSLASLVPGVIEGLVRDVTLAGSTDRADLVEIAAHAGCGLIRAPTSQLLRQALTAARGPHVFVLSAGFAPEHGYIEEMSDLLAGRFDRTAVLRSRTEHLFGRLFPDAAPVVGLIGLRVRLMQAEAADLAALARAARPSRTLRTRGRPVV